MAIRITSGLEISSFLAAAPPYQATAFSSIHMYDNIHVAMTAAMENILRQATVPVRF